VRRLVILCILVSWPGLPATAHQCILAGSSAEAIQIYNACKADLVNGSARHAAADNAAGDGGASDSAEARLAALQAENDALKARLADVRRRLFEVLGDL